MKKNLELLPQTVFNVTIKGMGSPYQLAQDLRKLADELCHPIDGTIDAMDIEGEWEKRSIVATFELMEVESLDGTATYTLLDEHPTKDTESNLFFDIVANCVFTPTDEELAEIEAQDAWDGYLLAVKQS